jgi:ribosomal RNA-processing protein 12
LVGSDPSAGKPRRRPGQDAAHFKTDKSGKLVIQESDGEAGDASSTDAARGAGNAFLAAQRGVDGASRDARGNLRFNKNTKRVREAEREDEAMELDQLVGEKKERKKRREVVKLGEEFRAKVSSRRSEPVGKLC